MEDGKPKSIKTVGLIITIISMLMIFSNSLAAINWQLNEFASEFKADPNAPSDPFNFVFSLYFEIALTMVILGVVSLISGIYIRKYKLWANRLMSLVSIAFLIAVISLTISMVMISKPQENMMIFNAFMYAMVIVWSMPPIFLIWFLNRRKIKMHFN